MNREVQALVLALLGASTLRISVTDAFLSYVREPMRPLLPVLAIFLVAPPPLGVEAAARDTGVIATEPAPWPDLPPGDPVEIGLDEFAARSYSEQGRTTLQDRRVRLVGFASPTEGGGGT